jgi:phosphoribosylanthranilate isomerase
MAGYKKDPKTPYNVKPGESYPVVSQVPPAMRVTGVIVNPTEDDISRAVLNVSLTLRGPLAISTATYLRMNQSKPSDYLRRLVKEDMERRRSGRGR